MPSTELLMRILGLKGSGSELFIVATSEAVRFRPSKCFPAKFLFYSTFSSSSFMGFSFANLILINSLRAAPVDRRN